MTEVFADGVQPLDVEEAIGRAGLDAPRLDAAGLGRPDGAGIPPEGGVLLSWDRGTTTLWLRHGEDVVMVVKRLLEDGQAEPVERLGEYAVLIDGAHVLETPSRHVAAGRVLWWLDGGREHRLESDLDAGAMIEIGRALAS